MGYLPAGNEHKTGAGENMAEINPITIQLPPEMEGRSFFTPAEFGRLVGKSSTTILRWGRFGWIRLRRFSPKCLMVPRCELDRYMSGEMMESGNQPARPENT